MILGSQRDVQAWADCAAPKKSRSAFERLCMRVVNIRSFSNRAGHLTAIGDFSVVEAFFLRRLVWWMVRVVSEQSLSVPLFKGDSLGSWDLRILQTTLSVFFATWLVAFLLEYDFVLQIDDGSQGNLAGVSTAQSPNM